MEQNYCPNLPTVDTLCHSASLTIWTDFMPSYISLDAAVILVSVTITEVSSTVHTHADMGLSWE
eukprot:scaffold15482_cov121-Skeletonema_dohrnii-CCMP3373.AAC.3